MRVGRLTTTSLGGKLFTSPGEVRSSSKSLHWKSFAVHSSDVLGRVYDGHLSFRNTPMRSVASSQPHRAPPRCQYSDGVDCHPLVRFTRERLWLVPHSEINQVSSGFLGQLEFVSLCSHRWSIAGPSAAQADVRSPRAVDPLASPVVASYGSLLLQIHF